MYKFWKKSLAATIVTAFLGMSAASAMPPIMPVGEVQQGMAGTAYTVVEESGEIRPFHVDVMGVVSNGKATTPLIMARASGEVIDEAGGVLQGMSGSPVYVDGRLVGALSAGFQGRSHQTFLITPIEEMMELWSMPDTKNRTKIQTVDLKKAAEEREKESGGETVVEGILDRVREALASASNKAKEKEAKQIDPSTVEEKSTVYLSGFDEAAQSYLKEHVFSRKNQVIKPMDETYFAGARSMSTDYQASLEPGSMMGVALAYGDFSIGATGTVTAVEGKRILGFGHPYLHKGNVNYFLTAASVVGTVASGSNTGAKISNIGNIIGRINQDREAGVAGEIGVFPAVVPMRATVTDYVLGRQRSYSTRIAYDEDLLAQISASMAYASMSKTVDNLGESTVQVHFTIRTDVAEEGKAERTNMFYNVSDVGQIAVLELAQAVAIICSNTDKESDILDVQVDIDVKDGRRTATIVSAVPDKTKVKPGETVNFTTTLKPYRQEKVTVIIPYKVPETQQPGVLALDVRGGGLVPVVQMLLPQGGNGGSASGELSTDENGGKSTKEKLKNFLSTGRNNEIIIAPGPSPVLQSEKEQKRAIREAVKASAKKNSEHKVNLMGANKENDSKETKFATEYIIENAIRTTLQVDK